MTCFFQIDNESISIRCN